MALKFCQNAKIWTASENSENHKLWGGFQCHYFLSDGVGRNYFLSNGGGIKHEKTKLFWAGVFKDSAHALLRFLDSFHSFFLRKWRLAAGMLLQMRSSIRCRGSVKKFFWWAKECILGWKKPYAFKAFLSNVGKRASAGDRSKLIFTRIPPEIIFCPMGGGIREIWWSKDRHQFFHQICSMRRIVKTPCGIWYFYLINWVLFCIRFFLPYCRWTDNELKETPPPLLSDINFLVQFCNPFFTKFVAQH